MENTMAVHIDQGQQKRLHELYEDIIPEDFSCPGTCEVMKNPVVHKLCGNSFEMEFVQEWLGKSQTCIVCRAHATMDDFVINRNLSDGIQGMTKILSKLEEKKVATPTYQRDIGLHESVNRARTRDEVSEQAPPRIAPSSCSAPVTAQQLCIELDMVAFKAPDGNASAENRRAAAATAHKKIKAKMRKEDVIESFSEDERRVIREAFIRNRSFMQGRGHNSNLVTILGGLKTIQEGH